jgi:serine/threonine-protein kinase
MVASIKHRFVVDVFDFGVTEDGLYYMVLELLQGPSLAQRMDFGPAFPVRTAVQLMADCLRGLQVVHEAGIVHRDLKPDNIFVIEDADGTFPKLIDFGISKRTQASGAGSPFAKLGGKAGRLTKPGTVIGTPYYMSPEQLRGRSDVDGRADVYSVGVILFELLTGRLPFREDNVGDLMVAITVNGPPSLAQLRPELGDALARIMLRALAADPDQRYASALELRDALLAALPGLPAEAESVVQSGADGAHGPVTGIQAARTPFRGTRASLTIKVGRVPVLWIVALGLLLIGMIVVWWPNAAEPKTAALPLRAPSAPSLASDPTLPSEAVLHGPVPQPRALPDAPAATPAEPAAVSGSGSATTVGDAQRTGSKRAAARAPRPTVPAPRNRGVGTPKPARPDSAQKLFRKLDF